MIYGSVCSGIEAATHGNSMSVNVMEWIGQRIELISKQGELNEQN